MEHPGEHGSIGGDGATDGARARLWVDLVTEQLHVSSPLGQTVTVSPEMHREDVVRRLLANGLSPETLHQLLPTWTSLIDQVAADV